jgi:hypothetical protein
MPTKTVKHKARKQSEWSLTYDEDLGALLERAEDDLDTQKSVCDALCDLGLAKRKVFGETTDTFESQEYHYTSTKAMRKLAKEWLYSTKHWRFPGDR